MSFSTENSAWRLTPQQEAEVAKMNSVSEIQMAMERFAREQGLYGGDPMDATLRRELPRPNVPANTPTAKVININGIKHFIQGATEDELVKNELAVMREIFGSAPAATQQQQRDENGRFVQQPVQEVEETVAESVAERLEREMVEKALQRQGIDPEALREYSEAKSTERFAETWEAAAEEFRNSPEGSRWEGGKKNQAVLGQCLAQLNLTDQPSAQSLAKAYQYMKANNLVAPNEEFEQERNIKQATSYEDIKRSVGYQGDGFSGSGIFGR